MVAPPSVLIVGGSGFLGSRLVKHLAYLGYPDVSVLTRNIPKARKAVQHVVLNERLALRPPPPIPHGAKNVTIVRFLESLPRGSAVGARPGGGPRTSSSTTSTAAFPPPQSRLLLQRTAEDELEVLQQIEEVSSCTKMEVDGLVGTVDGTSTTAASVPSMISVPARFDVVINLAGHPLNANRWNANIRRLIYESRIRTTTELVEWMVGSTEDGSSRRPKLFLSGSAIGFYPMDRGFCCTEESAPAKIVTPIAEEADIFERLTPLEFMTQISVDWEKAALRWLEDYSCSPPAPTVPVAGELHLLRSGVVLGRGGGAFQEMYLPFKLGLGSSLGDGKQFMSWIHIADWCGAVERIIQTRWRSLEGSALRAAVPNGDAEGGSGSFQGPPLANHYTTSGASAARTTPLGSLFPDLSVAEITDRVSNRLHVWNLTAPNPETSWGVSKALANAMGRPMFFSMPGFACRALFGEMADAALLEGGRVLPSNLERAGYYEFQFPEVEKCMEDLVA